MRTRGLVLSVLLAVTCLPPPAQAGDATGAAAPYEDLIEMLAMLTWHLRDDVHRFPPPKDPTGHDLYKLSLTRLESWEKHFPGRIRNITTLGRAEALERLGEYERAAEAYAQVAAMSDSPLAAKARETLPRAQAFAEAATLPEGSTDREQRLMLALLDHPDAIVVDHPGSSEPWTARSRSSRVSIESSRRGSASASSP